MLFFIDETWQTLDGREVGALGAVGVPRTVYNDLCDEVDDVKRAHLTMTQITDSELKGTRCFAPSTFAARERFGGNHWVDAAEGVFRLLGARGLPTFGIATADSRHLRLRNPNSTALSPPYKRLIEHLRYCAHAHRPDARGLLVFDLRTPSSDAATARAVQNWITRSRRRWRNALVQLPEFTISSASPGSQIADLVAYLAAQQLASVPRPELDPFMSQARSLAYAYTARLVASRTAWEAI